MTARRRTLESQAYVERPDEIICDGCGKPVLFKWFRDDQIDKRVACVPCGIVWRVYRSRRTKLWHVKWSRRIVR